MNTNKSKVVVVVEDEAPQRDEVLLSLQLAGITCFGAPDGATLDRLLAAHDVDVVVLDVGLPGESGLEIAARLSTRPIPVGVVMLTGQREMIDKLAGLTLGADAYLTKPADPRELLATIASLRRRMLAVQLASAWKISFDGRQLSLGSPPRIVMLSELQRLLLNCFKDTPPGQPIDKEVLMQALGYADPNIDPHRLETLVSRLRQKVRDKLGDDFPLQAVAGQGYALMRDVQFN